MRTLILLALILSAYGADFAADPEVIAAIKARDAADDKLWSVLMAKVAAMGLKELPPMKISDDPRTSEERQASALREYNHIIKNLDRWRANELRHDWGPVFCKKVDEMIALRAKAGVPIVPASAAPAVKPKSQITATLPDGTVITSDTRP